MGTSPSSDSSAPAAAIDDVDEAPDGLVRTSVEPSIDHTVLSGATSVWSPVRTSNVVDWPSGEISTALLAWWSTTTRPSSEADTVGRSLASASTVAAAPMRKLARSIACTWCVSVSSKNAPLGPSTTVFAAFVSVGMRTTALPE